MSAANGIDFGGQRVLITGEVTGSQGGRVSVQGALEYRESEVYAPYGLAYCPPVGKSAALFPAGEKHVCTGVLMQDKKLSSGEVMLFSHGGAEILLNRHGEIILKSSGGASLTLDKRGKVNIKNAQ